MAHVLNARCNDIFSIGPTEDRVVVTMITDPEHPEFDERALLPVDEELAWSIRRRGQLQPARGYVEGKNANGQQVVVLTLGRQRWKAVQHVWEQMRAEGLDPAMFPSFRLLVTNAKTTAERREERIIENLHRREVEGIALARDVRAHLDIVGYDDVAIEEARRLFNFKSAAALRNCLALLSTTPAVQELLEDGTITPTGGLHLSRQPEEVQDRVVGLLSASGDDGDDGDGDDEGGDDDRGTEGSIPPEPKPARTKSVTEVKQAINDATGRQTFAMVSLKQVEKQLERKEAELEKALTKLEQCPTSMYDSSYPKTVNQAAKVAEIQGEIKALRWARGENAASGSDAPLQGNDKMSAAWEALRDAITSAPWPKVLSEKDFEWPMVPAWSKDAGVQGAIGAGIAARRECYERIAESHLLVIAGEKVARREVDSQGKTYNILIDADSKWFTRLMDPFGKPSQLVRDWGTHGFLEPQGKAVSAPTYRLGCIALCKGQTAIQIKRGDSLDKWLEGTPLAFVVPSVSEIVRRIIGTLFPEKHIHHEIRFHTPYLEEGDGPDLNETLDARKEILSLIEKDLEIEFEEGGATWTTVGELVAKIDQAGVVHLGPNETTRTDDGEDRACPECGSTNLSGFVAGDKRGNATSTGFVCDDCDASFDPAEDDQAGLDGDE